jgi:hypothetical protein
MAALVFKSTELGWSGFANTLLNARVLAFFG